MFLKCCCYIILFKILSHLQGLWYVHAGMILAFKRCAYLTDSESCAFCRFTSCRSLSFSRTSCSLFLSSPRREARARSSCCSRLDTCRQTHHPCLYFIYNWNQRGPPYYLKTIKFAFLSILKSVWSDLCDINPVWLWSLKGNHCAPFVVRNNKCF